MISRVGRGTAFWLVIAFFAMLISSPAMARPSADPQVIGPLLAQDEPSVDESNESTGVSIAVGALVINGILLLVIIYQTNQARHTLDTQRDEIKVQREAVEAQQEAVEAQRDEIDAQRKAVRSDHERRRKQSTLEYYTRLQDRHSESRHNLHKTLGLNKPDDQLPRTEADSIYKLPEKVTLKNQLMGLMNDYEYLAVGVNTGIFDFDVVDRLGNKSIQAVVHRYKHWIDVAQEATKSLRTYGELEKLADDLKKREGERALDRQDNERGDIKHS